MPCVVILRIAARGEMLGRFLSALNIQWVPISLRTRLNSKYFMIWDLCGGYPIRAIT